MSAVDANARILVALAVVIAAARGAGWLATRVHQPRVLGEITAGILLGPSLLGAVAPSVTAFLFPVEVVTGLRFLAQIGVVLFMFLVGAEFEVERIHGQGHRAVVVSHASIIVPFLFGIALAPWLQNQVGMDTDPLGFALFLGAAMAITAFPVLARILQERGLADSRIGSLALTCAAVDDVTAWCVLAAVVAVVESSGAGDVLWTVGLTVAFVAVMLGVVRPLLGRLGRVSIPVAVALALLCGWLTEAIGVHAIFGAFLAGIVLPGDTDRRTDLTDPLESTITMVLLPVFFVVVGLATEFGSLDTLQLWGVTVVVIAVAVVGKLGGATMAARMVGEVWQDALTIGILMNTRGLTEIVILTVGLELGVLDTRLFTIMVLMALATTFMTSPLLGAIERRGGMALNGSASQRREEPDPKDSCG